MISPEASAAHNQAKGEALGEQDDADLCDLCGAPIDAQELSGLCDACVGVAYEER